MNQVCLTDDQGSRKRMKEKRKTSLKRDGGGRRKATKKPLLVRKCALRNIFRTDDITSYFLAYLYVCCLSP